MKTIGEVLKSAREERGISIEQAVHETNISREFIEALENESFDKFPAETYLIGFLKNYSAFLELDSDKTVGLYRSYILSLEPTPIDELIGPKKNVAARRYLILGTLVLFAVLAGFFGVPWFIEVIEQARVGRGASIEALDRSLPARELRPESSFWEGVVHTSDVVVLEDSAESAAVEGSENGELRLLIDETGERLRIDAMERGEWLMRLGEEIHIPNSDGQPSWKIYLKDIGLIGGGAVIEIQKLASEEAFVLSGQVRLPADRDEAGIQMLKEGATSTEAFVLDIVFQDFCLLRYQIDSKEAVEVYYSEGDNIRLDVDLGVFLLGSNAGAVNAKIGEKELKLGRDGEVFAYMVSWIIDESQGTNDLFSTPIR